MKLIEEEKFNRLIADEGKHIRAISDTYKEAYINEEGNKIEEYVPSFFIEAYVPKKINKNNKYEKYIEETIEGE